MSGLSHAGCMPSPGQQVAPGGRVIAVLGAKAGVGTSTVAVNLAFCTHKRRPGASVVLVDLNLHGGDLHLLLGLEPAHRWQSIVRESARLDATFLMSLLAKHTSGLHLLASDYDGLGDTALSPEVVARVLTLLRSLFPVVVVDCGHALPAPVRKVLEQATTVLSVIGLDIPTMRRAKRLLDLLRPLMTDPKKLQILLNGLDRNDRVLVGEAENVLGHRIAWQIPAAPTEARSAIEQGWPLCAISRRSDVVRAYQSLASALTEEEPKETKPESRPASWWRATLHRLRRHRSPQAASA